MKVTGTGGPAVLTVRFRERELPGLEAELAARRRDANDAIRQRKALDRVDRKTPEDLLAAVERLQVQVDDPTRREGDRMVVTGPTWLLGTVIVCAAIEAGEEFRAAMRRFTEESDSRPEDLRGALSAVSAWCETLMGYEHAETFGVEV